MTSRIPPSRRDPDYAPQRAAKVVQAETPGAGRVAQASPVLSGEVAALLRGKAGASVAPGTASLLGYAELTCSFPADMLSDETEFACTDASITLTSGDPAIAVAGGQITYAVGDSPSLYLVNAYTHCQGATTTSPAVNLANTVTTMVKTFDPVLGSSFSTFIGRGNNNRPFLVTTGIYQTASELSGTPALTWFSDVTTNVYLAEVTLYVARFAAV